MDVPGCFCEELHLFGYGVQDPEGLVWLAVVQDGCTQVRVDLEIDSPAVIRTVHAEI